MSKKTKILYLFDQGDWKSRMPVAEKAYEEGYEVTIALIGQDESQLSAIPDHFRQAFIAAPAAMKGRHLFAMVGQMREIIAKTDPHLIHTVTLKYAFITGLAALPFKALKKIYTLAGLGYLFRSHDLKAKLIRLALSPLLKLVLKTKNTTLIFQNPDDLALMVRLKFAYPHRSTLIRGSGVPLNKFNYVPEPDAEAPLVLMPTRLVHEKGLHIFIEAAKIIAKNNIVAKFQIAGGETRHNPKAISRAQMEKMLEGSPVEWLGRVDDMPALLQQAALIVYPSYYGEGIPRVLLESTAAGRPIITTDHAGCREAVDHGENGLLVPIKDVRSTASAMLELIQAPEKRAAMGLASRQKAEEEFDIHFVASQTLKCYAAALKDA